MGLKHNIPRLNSLRSRGVTYFTIDHDNYFPRLDMMTQRENYQKGDNNVSMYVDWVNGKEIRLQVQADSSSLPPIGFVLVNVNTGATTSLTYSVITPVGWVGYPVYECTYTPTTDGYYYIYYYIEQEDVVYFPEDTADYYFNTDVFKVRSDNDTEKDLVWFQYRNTYNKFGVVFGDDYFNAFFTGIMDIGESTTENTVTKEDDGTSLNQSKSYGAVKFTLTEIHMTQVRQIEMICQLNDLWINGQQVVVEAVPKSNKIDNSDLYNVEINATLANNDYFNDYYPNY